jgi:hypothetical protein
MSTRGSHDMDDDLLLAIKFQRLRDGRPSLTMDEVYEAEAAYWRKWDARRAEARSHKSRWSRFLNDSSGGLSFVEEQDLEEAFQTELRGFSALLGEQEAKVEALEEQSLNERLDREAEERKAEPMLELEDRMRVFDEKIELDGGSFGEPEDEDEDEPSPGSLARRLAQRRANREAALKEPNPEGATSTDATEPALWETETTEKGVDVVWLTDENWDRARDYVIARLEGAGIQVGEPQRCNLGEGDEMGIKFRGEAATISAPHVMSVDGTLCLSFTGEPEPENLRVVLYFGPPTGDYRNRDPHLYGVVGTVPDIIALIQY